MYTVDRFAPCFTANSNVKRKNRRQAASVTILKLCTTPGTISCSLDVYRSSVISLTSKKSILENRLGRPARLCTGRTEANSPSRPAQLDVRIGGLPAAGMVRRREEFGFQGYPFLSHRLQQLFRKDRPALLLGSPASAMDFPIDIDTRRAEDRPHRAFLILTNAAALYENHFVHERPLRE